MKSFNPTRVRLKGGDADIRRPGAVCFNPTRVRLKALMVVDPRGPYRGFNPTRVRLKAAADLVLGVDEVASTPQGFV